MRFIALFLLAFVSFIPKSSFAYLHFVGHGYTSCLTCHYNPYGNGPLNDYGRALSATAISARWGYNDFVPEEKIANRSGFLFKIPKNNYIRPSLDYRGLYIKRSVGQSNVENELIHMQGDASLVVHLNKSRSLFFSGTIGYAPTPAALEKSSEKVDNYRTREHYLGYRPGGNFGIYLGLMDRIYGLRVPEHSSYSRSINNLSHNDQSHGVQVHFNPKGWEIGAGYYLGNMVQEDDVRFKGYSTRIDKILSYNSSAGISAQQLSNEYLEQVAMAFHFTGGVGKGSSVVFEAGRTTATSIAKEEETTRDYAFIQSNTHLSRGVYLVQTVEYLKEKDADELYRFGPGLQLFPMQRLEVRTEIYNTKSFSSLSSSKDSWDLLSQMHIYF